MNLSDEMADDDEGEDDIEYERDEYEGEDEGWFMWFIPAVFFNAHLTKLKAFFSVHFSINSNFRINYEHSILYNC